MSAPESAGSRIDVRLVPAALTSWGVTAAGILWPVGNALARCYVVAVFAAGVLWWCARRWPGKARRLRAVGAGWVAVGVVGAGYALAVALRADAVVRHPITTAFGATAIVTVTPSESSLALGRGRLMFRATLQRLREAEMSGRVVVFARASEFGLDRGVEAGKQNNLVVVGQPVRFAARISRPTRHDLTVAVLTAVGRPTVGQAGPLHRAAHAVRSRFAAAARAVLPPDQAAMLPALVLGDTSSVPRETSREFRQAGMTHLTAVSGANVTIVCAAVLFSARLIGPRAAVALAGIALVAFVIVVQPTASVLRAAMMGAITLAAMLSSRRRQAIPALSASVLILLAAAPHLAVDIGFALSVAATAALVVIAPSWSRRLVQHGLPKPLADALAVAGAAQAVTAPLIAGISGRVSLVAAAANFVVAALIAPITVLGSAAAVLSAVWPVGAQLLIRFTGPELWWVLRVAHWASGVPAATVPVVSGVPGVLLVGGSTVLTAGLWHWPWVRRATGSALAVAIVCLLAWLVSGLVPGSGSGWSGVPDISP